MGTCARGQAKSVVYSPIGAMVSSYAWLHSVLSMARFIVQMVFVALVDLYIVYCRVGLMWRRRRGRPALMERRDLVMQLAPQSAHHSGVSEADVILHLNESFLDRRLWKGLPHSRAAPSAVVTDVAYGSIGFYTAMHLLLCGINVHGVERDAKQAKQTEYLLQHAVERQCRLHKEWVGKTGRMALHTCDLSDYEEVTVLVDRLEQDPHLCIIISCAETAGIPPRLTPQCLKEDFNIRHVGHSLLVLRLLQHRLSKDPCFDAMWPAWRIVVVTSAMAVFATSSPASTFLPWHEQKDSPQSNDPYECYSSAAMGQLLFTFALARYIRRDRKLAPHVTVNVLHSGLTRRNTRPSLAPTSPLARHWGWMGYLGIAPVLAALFVVDLALSGRHEKVSGHFFRMGEDQTVADAAGGRHQDGGLWRNSALYPGIPRPEVSLSHERQDAFWKTMVSFLCAQGLLDSRYFRLTEGGK